ncbi:G-D-S-L family lipolytic protein [Pontimicrobium sp. SW4]|uniref:G-D-S-L family lipolytic protein n=1 Tax=Pontimicrobium sp. SW4 TaxID=3153519 RepID=A0AAU7BSY7_9FLAO
MKTNIMNTKYIWLLLICLGFVACNDPEDFIDPVEPEVVLPPLTAGSADFSKFVSVGASFTAGYADGALFNASQQNSFPNIMAEQFAKAGGGSFTQPMMTGNFGGLALGGTRIADPRLVFGGAGPVPLESIIGPIIVATDITNNPTGPFNNMGVPGAKSFHLLAPGYGNVAGVLSGQANPYYVRMASSPTATVLGDVIVQAPTFFSLSEVGGNDVLGYATSGGTGVDQTGNLNPATYGRNDITDPNVFAQAFNGMVTTLTSGGAKGVVANVPNITDLPHFTTIPYNPVPLDAATAGALNAGYATYNGGLQQAFAALTGTGLFTQEELDRRTINFVEGQNAMVVIDEDLTNLGAINPAFSGIPQYRQATADDLFILSLSSLIPQGYGTQIPLEDKWVLTPEEQTAIQTATDAYNATISSVASANGVALVDLQTILNQAATTGIPFDDYIVTADLVTGGTVSLDGIHLTARGYAFMANKFLEAIDATYGSNFVASGNVAKANDYGVMYSPGL